MESISDMTIAVKCAPKESILDLVADSGIGAVELYTNESWLKKVDVVGRTCARYSLRYAIHAPTDGYQAVNLVSLVEQLSPEIVIFHNIYWEDEWEYLVKNLMPLGCKLCIENVLSVIDTLKYMRRFGLSRCLDLEHLILETSGIFEEPLFGLIKQSAHVHITGYVHGGNSWHTHLHHAPAQSSYLLDLLKKAGYSGLVVSEARTPYQTGEEFRALQEYFEEWKDQSWERGEVDKVTV